MRRYSLLITTLHFATRFSSPRYYSTLLTMASFSIPSRMNGVQIQHFGGPEVLQYKTDLPVPTPGAEEILVKNEFIGVNYVDVLVSL